MKGMFEFFIVLFIFDIVYSQFREVGIVEFFVMIMKNKEVIRKILVISYGEKGR